MITKQAKNTRTKKPKQSSSASSQAQPPQAGSELARSAAMTAAQFLKEFDQQQQAKAALGPTRHDREAAMPTKTAAKDCGSHRSIKLGLDVHADRDPGR